MGRLEEFEESLLEQEFSANTIQKYLRDAGRFLTYAGTEEPDRKAALGYKEYLQRHYQPSSVNSMLAAVNCLYKHKHHRIKDY